jgi:glycosyltransferase involved in cell wall biosynthesis
MDQESLDHLERIEAIVASLAALPWIGEEERGLIARVLLDFDAEYWTFTRYLSLPLYEELRQLLGGVEAAACLQKRPRMAVVMPVHRASEALLRPALQSLRNQVGVAIECLISVDGEQADLALVQALLADFGEDERWRASVFFGEVNRGVGMCRNRALREITSPFFTLLDDDDLFHPLRCLHGWLLLALQGVPLLSTSWSRVSMSQRKIVIINNSLVHCGLNSFIAATDLLSTYGYMADLRFFEDSEYMQRLQYFGVPRVSTAVVGHYLHTEPRADYVSLASHWRQEVHPIEGHPYLCGSVVAAINEECLGYEQEYRRLYGEALAEGLRRYFPAA